jgi:hypothetical protein
MFVRSSLFLLLNPILAQLSSDNRPTLCTDPWLGIRIVTALFSEPSLDDNRVDLLCGLTTNQCSLVAYPSLSPTHSEAILFSLEKNPGVCVPG